jgi:hypothetical protein
LVREGLGHPQQGVADRGNGYRSRWSRRGCSDGLGLTLVLDPANRVSPIAPAVCPRASARCVGSTKTRESSLLCRDVDACPTLPTLGALDDTRCSHWFPQSQTIDRHFSIMSTSGASRRVVHCNYGIVDATGFAIERLARTQGADSQERAFADPILRWVSWRMQTVQ